MNALDHLEALLAKATKGPWELCDKGDYGDFDGQSRVVLGDIEPDLPWRIAVFQVGEGETEGESNANAEIAVAAVNTLPALISAARALEPFATAWAFGEESDDAEVRCVTPTGVHVLSVRHFRAALAALAALKEPGR